MLQRLLLTVSATALAACGATAPRAPSGPPAQANTPITSLAPTLEPVSKPTVVYKYVTFDPKKPSQNFIVSGFGKGVMEENHRDPRVQANAAAAFGLAGMLASEGRIAFDPGRDKLANGVHLYFYPMGATRPTSAALCFAQKIPNNGQAEHQKIAEDRTLAGKASAANSRYTNSICNAVNPEIGDKVTPPAANGDFYFIPITQFEVLSPLKPETNGGQPPASLKVPATRRAPGFGS